MSDPTTAAPPDAPPTDERTYLGDGLYATFDGFQIWLIADRFGQKHEVALEGATFAALLAFARRLGLPEARA